MKPRLITIAVGLATLAATAQGADLRIGIIGLDTSHVVAFTRLINDASAKEHVPGGRVTVAFKSFSPDIPTSADRVDRFTREVQHLYGVKLVDSIPALCAQVDAVLLESVDGRPHLAQARPVFQAHKPVFIDKPLAGSLHDVIEIYRLAEAAHVPVFSASAYRYYRTLQALKQTDVGHIRGAVSYGPCTLEPHHPDLFWYGIHPTEALFTILGPACERVSRIATADTDVVSGEWSGGRTGVLYGLRHGTTPHRVIVFGTKAVVAQQSGGDDYAPLVRQIMRFFQTGVAPVSPRETLAIYAFMAAADQSKREGGAPVSIREVLKENGWAGR